MSMADRLRELFDQSRTRVTGSNYYTQAQSAWESFMAADTAKKLEKISEVVTHKYLPFGDLLDSFKSLKPVYKIMITMPHLEDNVIEPYRYILADTSRPYVNFLGKSDSPILGLWVDQSDLLEPDKVILLMQNPVSHEGGTFESDILRFPHFGVRNWIDVWMGYAPLTPGRSVMNLGQIADWIDMMSLKIPGLDKVAFTLPDPFFFGNESHIFSGPIVSIKREIKPSGDRLQLIGFSPVIILRQMRAREFKVDKDITLEEAVLHAARSVEVFPHLRESVEGFTRDHNKFYFGQFNWKMFGYDSYNINTAFGRMTSARITKVTPVVFDPSIAAGIRKKYPLSNPLRDADEILTKIRDEKFKLRSKIEPSNKTTLYDILFRRLTDPTLTGLYGLYAFIRPTPTTSTDSMQAFRDGKGHPGVHIRYGFKFEIEGILHQIRGVKPPNYGPEMRQEITLGRTAREFEGGIEYGTVFNTKQFMLKTGENVGEISSLVCPTGSFFFEKIKRGGTSEGRFTDHEKFWESLLDDISVYGETFNPITTWIWSEEDQDTDVMSKEIGDSITQTMRESYFAGMGGSVYAVGNPSLKPGRVLDIKDERTALSEDLTKKIEDTAKSRISKLINVRSIPASPPALRLKNIDKMFYIWKVRHYLGVRSGFITKIYFIEERNRAWQQYTESIDQVIRAALGQAKQLMGVI